MKNPFCLIIEVEEATTGFGFGGIKGGMFFDLKLELRLRREESGSVGCCCFPSPSLNRRPRGCCSFTFGIFALQLLSVTSALITLSEVLLRALPLTVVDDDP